MNEAACTNRLIGETSPYLLQHAHNPVDWYPWGKEALEKARREGKPVLLSIGYSACHWCHVMAHESFEDPETASVMNALFVNIKVDREERPDLDKIYQTAHQLLTQRAGGWPLTMFLTPDDRIPFFGGTYFPPEPRHGLPSFRDLMRRVVEFYREHDGDIRKQNRSLIEVFGRMNAASQAKPASLDRGPLDTARAQLEESFDQDHGGFGQAPKFPHPTSIERLLRHWAGSAAQGEPDGRALEMALTTLEKMAKGGIYDQVGGGFCRYSVDDLWMIPHFEKMLYDNGPLLALYGQAWAATGKGLFRRVAEETGEWVMREMQSPEGGYYSTLDADSEGEEGKFYVWERGEVRSLLDEQEYRVVARRFGLNRPANFEGKWHLHVHADVPVVARALSLSEAEVASGLASAKAKLFEAREHRVRPGRDDKILTSWNALMIKGMAVAGRHLERPDFLDSATRALDFVRTTLWRDGRLLATCKDGRAHLPAYLDDYAFLVEAILELLQARWRDDELDFALALAEVILEHFEDSTHGGFYFTADDHEQLIHRPKPFTDDATPSGNGIAAYALGRLGHLLGEPRYLSATERTLKAAWEPIVQAPFAYNALLLALEEYLAPPQMVTLRGAAKALAPWHQRASAAYAPQRYTLTVPSEARDVPAILAERKALGDATAYVCTGTACSAPITDFKDLASALAAAEPRLA